jgi:hypothetical protein
MNINQLGVRTINQSSKRLLFEVFSNILLTAVQAQVEVLRIVNLVICFVFVSNKICKSDKIISHVFII